MFANDPPAMMIRGILMTDTFAVFAGYENADWFIPAPALKAEDVDLKLSPDQIRETLNYFSEYNSTCFFASLANVPVS